MLFPDSENMHAMQLISILILTLFTSAAVVYAHKRLPTQTKTPVSRWIGHGTLIGIGLAFGATVAGIYYGSTEGLALFLIFLSAFGMVHVPAAFILMIKRRQ